MPTFRGSFSVVEPLFCASARRHARIFASASPDVDIQPRQCAKTSWQQYDTKLAARHVRHRARDGGRLHCKGAAETAASTSATSSAPIVLHHPVQQHCHKKMPVSSADWHFAV